MKEIKFRGKRIKNGNIVFGNYIAGVGDKFGKHYILPIQRVMPSDCHDLDGYEVIGETVSQFTGFKHKKTGKDIFEFDIFREEKETDDGDERTYCFVMWIKQRGAFYLVDVAHYEVMRDNDCEFDEGFQWLFTDAALYDFSMDIELDLVGNVFDNPELLK